MTDAAPVAAAPALRPAPLLSFMFTYFNEEDVLAELVARVRKVCDAEKAAGNIRDHEMVFVDDCSTDRSGEILRELARDRGDIRILTTSRKFGISTCQMAGFERVRGDVMVYMDADLQDPPEIVPQLLAAWRADPEVEVVHTIRTRRNGETWWKLFVTAVGYRILRSSSTVELPIEAGDYKLVSRQALNCMLKLREKRPYIRGIVAWVGFKQTAVHYHRDERFGGETKFPTLSRGVLSNFFDSALISFSDVPLKASIVAGLLCCAATAVYILAIVLLKLLGMNPGFSLVSAVILLVGGMNLLSIGIMGLYVNAIFLEAKARPNIIIKEEFGFADDASR